MKRRQSEKPSGIIVCLQEDDPRARYVFKNALTMLGAEHTIEVVLSSGSRHLSDRNIIITWSDGDGSGSDIHFPRSERHRWQRGHPGRTFIEDVPVLYSGEKPAFLFQQGSCGFDFVGSVFYLLSRQEERLYQHRDLWGCFSAYYSILYEHGILQRPLINCYLQRLKGELQAAAQRKGILMPLNPIWPDGKSFAVCLTHDVDLIGHNCVTFGVRNARRAMREKAFHQAARSLLGGVRDSIRYARTSSLCGFEEWLKVEDEMGARSSFYFIPFSEQRHSWDSSYDFADQVEFNGRRLTVSAMMREMVAGGWEVGLHGSYYSFDDAARLTLERESLESAAGERPAGVRQHYLHLNIPDTWRAQCAASFEYDTTLGYNEEVGHRAGVAFPFTTYDLSRDCELPLIEIPLTIQDNVLVNYLRLDLEGTLRRCFSVMDEVASVGGLITLLWHPNTYRDHRLWAAYRELLSYAKSKGAWLASAGQIARHWRERLLLLSEGKRSEQCLEASAS
jgi:hypothetical protein